MAGLLAVGLSDVAGDRSNFAARYRRGSASSITPLPNRNSATDLTGFAPGNVIIERITPMGNSIVLTRTFGITPYRVIGSSRSRTQSPIKLTASVVTDSTTPGNTAIHQAEVR